MFKLALATALLISTLDPSFGAGGLVTTTFAENFDEARAVAIQPDGKIVAAGFSVHTANNGQLLWDYALARYDRAGQLDPTFGNGGRVLVNVGNDFDIALAVAIQSDGKIVAGGLSRQRFDFRTSDMAVVRVDPDGSPDQTFSGDGIAKADFGGRSDELEGIAVQRDGKIVAFGTSAATDADGNSNGTSDFALARFTTDGQLDTGFGSGGRQRTDFAGGEDFGLETTIQPDGRIIAAGSAQLSQTSDDFALARYRTDGTLDPSFGSGGKVTTHIAASDEILDVTVQNDGKILASGAAGLDDDETVGDFALARYNPNGTLDGYFGRYGTVVTSFTKGVDLANAVAVQKDGRIVAGGVADFVNSKRGDFALTRYNADGTPDGSFGKVTTDFRGEGDIAFGMAIQADGRVVLAGRAGTPQSGRNFGLARYV